MFFTKTVLLRTWWQESKAINLRYSEVHITVGISAELLVSCNVSLCTEQIGIPRHNKYFVYVTFKGQRASDNLAGIYS